MKLKDYNTTAKMYQLFLQFKDNKFNYNNDYSLRYLEKNIKKAKNEPTIISSWDIAELTDSCQNGEHHQTENTLTLKDYIYRICENKHFNDKKFSTIKTEIFQLVSNLTQIPRDLINFSIIMKPRGNSNGDWVIVKPDEEREYNSKCNNITEDTIYNNKDYVLTVNITTPLNDLMRFSLFFYQKWMDVIEGKRLMQDGYKKTLEKYKSTEINKELLDDNKNLKAMVKSLKYSLEQQIERDADSIIKIENTFNQRFIEQVEMNHRKNIEFDELISKKDNEIKRLTEENEDFLKLVNERDSIIEKQSEGIQINDKFSSYQDEIAKLEQELDMKDEIISRLTNNENKLRSRIHSLSNVIKEHEQNKLIIYKENRELKDNIIYLDKENKELNDLINKKEWANNQLKNLTEKLEERNKELFELQFLFNLQHETLNDFTSKYLEMRKISENLAIQSNQINLKNKYNENLMIAYSNACKEILNNFCQNGYCYKEISGIINKHIDKIPE